MEQIEAGWLFRGKPYSHPKTLVDVTQQLLSACRVTVLLLRGVI